MVLLCVAAVAVLAGLITFVAARRWPRLDPVAPKVDVATPAVKEQVRKHPGLRALLRREIDPATATSLIVTVALAALVLTVVAAGGLLLMVKTHSGLAKWDLALARWGGHHATTNSTLWLKRLSMLGGTLIVVTVSVLVALTESLRRRDAAVAGIVALAVGGQFAVVNLIKVAVARPRPAIHQLTGFHGASFPSGHSAAAAVTYAVLALVLGRGRPRVVRNALAGAAVAMSVLVAGTRVMLGVHWFTDVLAGVAVGWAWLAVCSIAFGGRMLHFGAPVEAAEAVAATTPPKTPTPPPLPPRRTAA
jgi:membrane-associated phospholipid phosphatase